jgi:hypothetical protein
MPGPSPEYQPRFRPEEIQLCQELVVRRIVPHGEAKRAQLALLLAEDPKLSNPEAGRRVGYHENSVRYWRRVWTEEGLRLKDLPRAGRKPVFSPRADRSDQSDRL